MVDVSQYTLNFPLISVLVLQELVQFHSIDSSLTRTSWFLLYEAAYVPQIDEIEVAKVMVPVKDRRLDDVVDWKAFKLVFQVFHSLV